MKIVILGGGLCGMAAANVLSKNHDVTVLEKETYLGGLAASFEIDGRKIPSYYHHVFTHDKITRKYLDFAGIKKGIEWKKIKMGLCVNNKKYDFANPLGLLKFNYISVPARIKYGLFGAYAFFLMNPNKIPDNLGAREWLLKTCGKEITDKIFVPLYEVNKFDTPLEELSAKQLAFRLAEGEALGKFGYPKKGLEKMIEWLECTLKKHGVKLVQSAGIKAIDLKKKEIILKKMSIKYDALISTIPVPAFLSLVKGIPTNYKKKISCVRYTPCINVVFGTEDFLSNNYWLNIYGERIGMLIQHSHLNDTYGYKVNYACRYGGSAADLNLSDKEIAKSYLAPVKKYFPRAKILWFRVSRNAYAEPVYDKHFAEYSPSHTTPVDGLHYAGTSVFFPKIRTMNCSLEDGEAVARAIQNRK